MVLFHDLNFYYFEEKMLYNYGHLLIKQISLYRIPPYGGHGLVEPIVFAIASFHCTAPEINISPVLDIVSGSRHFVQVTRNSYRSSVSKFENLPVNVTGRKRILWITHEIVSDSDRWLAVVSCTAVVGSYKNKIVPCSKYTNLNYFFTNSFEQSKPKLWKDFWFLFFPIFGIIVYYLLVF